MKSSNSPESKNRKRKVALANLEKDLPQYQKSLQEVKSSPSVLAYTEKQIYRITKEIATLKARILN